MNYTIKCYKNTEEAEVIFKFLQWQGYTPFLESNISEILDITSGRDIPVLYDTDNVEAKGFYEVYAIFKSKHLLR